MCSAPRSCSVYLAFSARAPAAHRLPSFKQGADGTVYEGLTFRLSLNFGTEYPFKAPVVKFETSCFHPNVDLQGNICLDILKEKWSGIGIVNSHDSSLQANITLCSIEIIRRWKIGAAAYSVRTVLQSIQSLLADPNNDSPLNVQAAKMWDGDRELYRQVAGLAVCRAVVVTSLH